ncbi:MAG: hypothetical protein NTW21_12895 [Verrucomicrobia bacterium]|nr:hypothetical protein [Verrucomicrobiota bacterium]
MEPIVAIAAQGVTIRAAAGKDDSQEKLIGRRQIEPGQGASKLWAAGTR